MSKQRILSGMRPTGRLHIGHLFGALSNWAALQDEYDCFYMIADWHALMSEWKNPGPIGENSLDNVADWLACGLDPDRSTIFVQSDVPYHSELHLVLSAITPITWLERCPTYKEQVQALAEKDVTNYAFLGYPVLQASDIALYKGNAVPVGEDQVAHLELTREILRRFNGLYGEVFPEPQPKLTQTSRLLGTDGRKMSKSYGNAIGLGDSPDDTTKKIKSMFTDPQRVKRNDPGRPEICNVHSYYEIISPEKAQTVAEECRAAKRGCTDCKAELAEDVNEYLAGIRETRRELLSDTDKLQDILDAGAARANDVASHTMDELRGALKWKKRWEKK